MPCTAFSNPEHFLFISITHLFFPWDGIMSPWAEARVNSCAFVLWVVTGNQQCIHLPNALHRGDCFQLHSVIESIRCEWQALKWSTDFHWPQPQHDHLKAKYVLEFIYLSHLDLWLHAHRRMLFTLEICRITISRANVVTGSTERVRNVFSGEFQVHVHCICRKETVLSLW